MYKERIVSGPKWGRPESPLYNNQSTGTWIDPKLLSKFLAKEATMERLWSAVSNATSTMPAFTGKETIWSLDNKIPKKDRMSTEHMKTVFKPVYHTYFGGLNLRHGYASAGPISQGEQQVSVTPSFRLSLDYFDSPRRVSLYVPELTLQRGRAWHTMQPRFKGETEMLNFLFELKDFRDLAQTAFKLITGKYGSKLLEWSLEQKAKKALLDPSRPVAEGILTYNLAIAPLIADIHKIVSNLLQTAEEARQKFNSDGETAHTVHYTEVLKEELGVASPSYTTYRMGWQETSVFNASMQRIYSVRPQGAFQNFRKYWGLEFTPEVIWNALPLSFLADYIASIGVALRFAEPDATANIHVTQYCESLKFTANTGMFLTGGSFSFACMGTYKFGPQTQFVTGITDRIYNRYITTPLQAPYVPRLKRIKSRQLLNVAALLRVFH